MSSAMRITMWTGVATFLMSAAAWMSAANAAAPAAEAKEKTYRGKFFEVRHPADFVAVPLAVPRAAESDAATFTSPDQSVTFYVYSPQWAGEAPGIALDAQKETEVERRSAPGKSSGVAGTFTWTTLAAKDKSYTRSYQRFEANDKSIHWVIGLKYANADVLKRHEAAYARFKATLVQLAD
ncbi:MAG: hypothetical protein JNJ55_09395 [Betaproteobacteria bacterium]|nr:hypothetical protein [Betaproteobacteria bacterium]